MDCQISQIIVILDRKCENDLAGAVAQLKAAGMQVERADDDQSVVEGTIDAGKVHDLKNLDCVDYVRTVLTYDAEFPPGDPRDRNNM